MENWQLKQKQSLPLEAKILLTKSRIREWYDYWCGNVALGFSGGKDSTVLRHIIKSMYLNIESVFCDTGLEFPEIRCFVKQQANVVWLKPRKSFYQVIKEYGYPVVSKEVSQKISEVRTTKSDKLRYKRLYGDNNPYKSGKIPEKWKYLINAPFNISHKCCHYLKKDVSKRYEKASGNKMILAEMVVDSHARKQKYLRNGCNAFSAKRQISNPMSFWTEANVWQYIKQNNVEYCEIYDMGYQRTGCIFCAFGCHLEREPNKFQLLQQTHPKLWSYCMDKLGMEVVLNHLNIPIHSTA
jgi:3'-phosphoadenosine 5'-phosphosulfate sulfotransferase (PAPS reductase)/FAD synthetase